MHTRRRWSLSSSFDPASDCQRDRPHLAVDRRYARDLAVGAGVIADRADVVARNQRRNIDRELRFTLDGKVIVIGEIEPPHRVETAFDRRRAPAEKEDDVLAESLQLLAIAIAEALAHSRQQQQRTYAPGDSKHGQEGAQLVRPQGS